MGFPRASRIGIASLAIAAATGLTALAGVAAAGTPSSWKITVVNSTGQDPANVFVALPSSGAAPASPSTLPAGFAMDTAYALDPIGGATPWVSEGSNRYSITLSGPWNSGTILYSLGQGYGAKPTAGQNTSPYDFSELTVDSNGSLNGDISSVDQIGVPARLSVLSPGRVQAPRDGSSQAATEYVGCVNSTWNLLQRYAGSTPPNTFRTSGGQFLQLLGPSAGGAWTNYPSFRTYVTNVARAGFTVTGNFAGSSNEIGPGGVSYTVPGTTYSYTGSLTPDGQWIKISGTLGTPPGNQMDMYVPISEMWTHDDSTWTGANGYGVYRQNGPYVLVAKGGAQPSMGATAFYYTGSGTVPTSGPLTLGGWTPVNPPAGAYATDANDLYGWIYGDLVASFAMGYWGSNYGSDSSAWNTNATPPWGVGSAGKAPFAAAWTNPFPGYPLFNVYQAAVDATGTTYGSPLNDRFTPPATTSPEIAVTPPQPQSGPYTWQVELLAQQGCAQALSVSPASGPASGGQQVTITGRNFHQGATVTFGGAPATNVQVTHNPATSLDTITATTPKAPAGGPVNVRVTNAYGSKAQNIDTSVLANAYAYPASGSGGQAGGIPVPPGGVGLGAGVFKYPGAGCSIREVVRGVMQAKPARAPRVTVPSGGIMQLAVRGLPKKAEASIDIQVNGQWEYIGRVRSNAEGAAVLPRYAQTTRGQSTLIRARAGKKGMRYLRTIAGPPRDWGGRALSPVVTSYPVGTCPVHYAAARKPVAAALGKAPVAAVPLGGITVVRVRGLKRNESTGIDVKVGSSWRFIGRVKAARNGRLAMPPVAVNQRQQVVQVRLRGDRETRYVKLRAS